MSDLDMEHENGFDVEAMELGAPGEPPELSAEASAESRRMDSILRIPVVVQVVVGSATLPVSSLLKSDAAPSFRWIIGSAIPSMSSSTGASSRAARSSWSRATARALASR